MAPVIEYVAETAPAMPYRWVVAVISSRMPRLVMDSQSRPTQAALEKTIAPGFESTARYWASTGTPWDVPVDVSNRLPQERRDCPGQGQPQNWKDWKDPRNSSTPTRYSENEAVSIVSG